MPILSVTSRGTRQPLMKQLSRLNQEMIKISLRVTVSPNRARSWHNVYRIRFLRRRSHRSLSKRSIVGIDSLDRVVARRRFNLLRR